MTLKEFLRRIVGSRLLEHKRYVLFYFWYVRRNSDLGKALKFLICYFRYLLRLSLSKPDMKNIVKLNGYQLKVMPDDRGISRELLVFRVHEPLLTRLLSMEIKRDMVCIDIGANIGYYALLESKLVGEDGKVIVFEPSPANFKYLSENLNSQSQKFSHTEAHNVAIGSTDGYVNFLIQDWSNLCRVIDEPSNNNNDNNVIKVPVRRLDSFLKENPLDRLDFIRMDVEGYEVNIYKGMKEIIAKFRPMLLMEVHKIYLGVDGTREFLLELKNDGYEIKYYTPGDLDRPLIGNIKHIEKLGIDELIKRLEKDYVPDGFNLFLVNRWK